jgi:ArsR family transcriptional regulator
MGAYKRLAVIMKALGHPVRLQILEALHEEEACVCHLEALLGLRQAYISQHLARLRDARLVVDRREGMNVYYSLAHESIVPLLGTARATASGLAQADGETLAFGSPTRAADCPCPKCLEKRGVLVV